MSDNTQATPRPFEFQARTVTSGQTDALEVDVKNVSGAGAWGTPLLIELKLPVELVTQPVRDASLAARTNEEPKNMATLGGVVNVAAGWSVWAINEPNDHVVAIRVFNNVDQQTGTTAGSTAKLDAGAVLQLRIPLAPAAKSTQFTLLYGYQTGRGKDTRFDGSLELKPSQLADWKPHVVLECKGWTSPTMLPPGEEVKVAWEVKNGVAATLRGPLPGGNSELALSRDQSSNFKMEEGWLTTLAVGPATYILDAEVKGPEGQPNVQVLRTLTLDIFSGAKYGNLTLRPNRVLPNGLVEIDWAVWGVDAANIDVGGRLSLDLELTQQNLSRTYQGTGIWRVHAKENLLQEPVSLTIQVNKKTMPLDDSFIKVTQWEKVKGALNFSGKPVALAVAEGNMALLTSDGLYTANVGKSDTDTKDPNFVKLSVTGKAWYALAPYGREFVVLRRTDGGDVVVERYEANGNRPALPVTLPGDFQTLAGRVGSTLDLAVYGSRAYVVVDAPAYGRTARSAYSLRLDAVEPPRPEGMLAALLHYRLISSCGALYAFRRGTGRMLRFGQAKTGDLEEPTSAASAVNDNGESMIKTGLLVPAGSVFTVLDPAALPALDALRVFGLQNVMEYALKSAAGRKVNEIPQDLAYNPQQDRWTACGQGLQIQGGAIAAYRGGGSKRLWVLQPDGAMHKLSGAKEELFAADYVEKFPHKVLPPVFDATREFTIVNLSTIELVPMDDVCIAAGLPGFGAEGMATLTTPIPRSMQHSARQTFRVSYNSKDTSSVSLRMMAVGCQGSRYYCEVTLSGPGLTAVVWGFKRLSPEGQVANVPQAGGRQGATVDIRLTPPSYLKQETALYVVNVTPRDMVLDPRLGTDKINPFVGVEINYKTPPFNIIFPGMESSGHLTVDLDFTKTMGYEASPSSQPQSNVIRVNTDNVKKLDAEVNQHSKFHLSIAEFRKHDGTAFRIGQQKYDLAYSLQVRFKTLQTSKSSIVLEGVRLGDGALTRDGKYVWVALARPYNVPKVRIFRINTDTMRMAEQVVDTPGGVYSFPNAIVVSDRTYYAMLGETSYYQGSPQLEQPTKHKVDGYIQFMSFAASPEGRLYFIGRWEKWVGSERVSAYALVNEDNSVVIQLDRIRSGSDGLPMAVSPDGNTVAVCVPGGMLIVDVLNRTVHEATTGFTEPAAVVFANDGQGVYFAHVTKVMSNNPRRADSGRDIKISRIGLNRPKVAADRSLENVNSNFGLTAHTRPGPVPNEYSKEQVALSLAVSPDDKYLFVSAGTSIMRFAISYTTFNLQTWRETVELPCRLVGVKMNEGGGYTVIALGSYYRGDGTTIEEYKTQLYFVPAPAN